MTRSILHNRFRRWIAPAILCFGVTAVAASAQTRFEWPDSRIDVAQYRYLENCFAAAKRVRDSVYARDEVLADTISIIRRSISDPLPQGVTDIARRCTEKYPVESVPVRQTFLAQELFLMAGRDADAAAVVQRRLNSLKSQDSVEHAYVLDTAAKTYLTAIPSRIAAAKPLIDQVYSAGATLPFQRRMQLYYGMTRMSDFAKDAVLTKQYGQAVLDVAHGVSTEELGSSDAMYIPLYVRATNRILYRAELLDSLRKGTDAYVTLQQALYAATMGRPDPDMPLGKPAPVVEGDFWFPDSAKSVSYPRLGRVTVVIFIPHKLRVYDGKDETRQAMLHRLVERYPNVDLVFAAGTKGWFGPLEPPTAREEATLLNRMFREFLGFPAILSVSTRSFIRVSDPDRRRLYQPTSNEENYPERSKTTHIFIIDRDNKMVETGWLGEEEEVFLGDMVGILLERTHTVASE